METTRPPGFPGNPPARMPRAPTPARSPPPRPLRRGEMTFRPTHDVGPRTPCISGLNPAAYGLPVNASRPGSPQAHASLGSGWRPTLAGWDWLPTGFRTRFRRSHHGILSPLTGLSRHTRWCTDPAPSVSHARHPGHRSDGRRTQRQGQRIGEKDSTGIDSPSHHQQGSSGSRIPRRSSSREEQSRLLKPWRRKASARTLDMCGRFEARQRNTRGESQKSRRRLARSSPYCPKTGTTV